MLLDTPIPLSQARLALCEDYLADETVHVQNLLKTARLTEAQQRQVRELARDGIEQVRQSPRTSLETFVQEYALSNQEGVVLMCLAEALLRIPDEATVDLFIRDTLNRADWDKHLGHSDSLFVNASTWMLILTGKITHHDARQGTAMRGTLQNLLRRSSEPVIRLAVKTAMRIIGQQFVMAENIEQAWSRIQKLPNQYLASIDMLGEAALTHSAAEKFYRAYHTALQYMGERHDSNIPVIYAPGLSVKLSALHPRFELAQRNRLLEELLPKLRELCLLAKHYNLQLTIDAEESYRLDPLLDVFTPLVGDPKLRDWHGLGLAVQAYQKRAPRLIDYLAELASEQQRRICVRLVKGAYWDSEIKSAQLLGLADYPVYTRKQHTDVSYLACAKRLFAAKAQLFPQFATHNAYTLASILVLAGDARDFEFQRLHGMGEALYDYFLERHPDPKCRIYAPVGKHAELLPYLVRRLLENGANTSFVYRISDSKTDIEQLLLDPVAETEHKQGRRHRNIVVPGALFEPERINAAGVHLDNPVVINQLTQQMKAFNNKCWNFGSGSGENSLTIVNPADALDIVGHIQQAEISEIPGIFNVARDYYPAWSNTSPAQRADLLQQLSVLLEQHTPELLALLIREAGRGIRDALAELREAVDFCRYYATKCQQLCTPQALTGPTGESNQFSLSGRGVMLCVSPWNFPLSIFLGQVSGALAAGNCVIAKPASATPLIAARVMTLMHDAGFPKPAVQLVIGRGDRLSSHLLDQTHLAGVLFTGSTSTARDIHRRLAQREGPILPLIAETGGINAMIVDSSALPEQAVADIMQSAFNSAGQRCSALRLLYLQSDVAERILSMLIGNIEQWHIGNPGHLATDMGPVINRRAVQNLQEYCNRLDTSAKCHYKAKLHDKHSSGSFFAPRIYELESGAQLREEVFGPVLHIVRYEAHRLDDIVNEINASDYGLTLGIHSRIQHNIDRICNKARIGNIYINRNMIGAVVGVQPFGGEGLSGTGPKAGGPNYLLRLSNERVISNNITAIGGNPSLLSQDDD